jgi:predicted Zn-dependent protease
MRSTIAAAILAAIALLGGCVTNPSTGRSQLILFSAEQVAAMGAEATPQMIDEFGGEVPESELRAYVDRVGRALAAHVEPEYAGVEWQFFCLDSDVVNAFALPGGKVFITRGLLAQFENEAQVAGTLGHEIGHVTGRHVDERLSQAATAQVGLAVLGATTDAELVTLGADLLTQGALLKFNRDQETESDSQGLKYMTRAGYDPRGMQQVLEVLAAAAQGSRPPEILSTHPHPETRVVRVEAEIRAKYGALAGDPGYGLHAERFQREAAPYLGAR